MNSKKRPKIIATVTSSGKNISVVAYPNGRAKIFEHDQDRKIVTQLVPMIRRVDIIAAEFERLKAKLTGKPKRILKLRSKQGGISHDRERGKQI